MTLTELARKLRPFIEKAAAGLQDEDALEAVELFPAWEIGIEYRAYDENGNKVDTRVRYGGILYRCLQSHTSQETWNPVDASSLWAKVLVDTEKIYPWEQPSSTNPYNTGDKVYYPTKNDPIYISTINNNVWAPDVYGWELYSP